MLKRAITLLLCLSLLLPFAGAAAEGEGNAELLQEFTLHHGDRSVPKIAITVDDCYKSAAEWIEKDVELCRQFGIAMTFFPVVYTGCLEEKYRDLWQSVLDCGCEIGSHTESHKKIGNRPVRGILRALGNVQEALDKTLGYHYQIRWLRPPYGKIDGGSYTGSQQVVKTIRGFGYEHIVHWDVSETKDLKKAMKAVKNGSILLFHAKKRDCGFLEKLIPKLLESGFELVTVSELFGYDPPETGGALYEYRQEDYLKEDGQDGK